MKSDMDDSESDVTEESVDTERCDARLGLEFLDGILGELVNELNDRELRFICVGGFLSAKVCGGCNPMFEPLSSVDKPLKNLLKELINDPFFCAFPSGVIAGLIFPFC